jgi:hypothetical protein
MTFNERSPKLGRLFAQAFSLSCLSKVRWVLLGNTLIVPFVYSDSYSVTNCQVT